MTGLMSRILSRRSDGAAGAAPEPTGAAPADQPTVVVPAVDTAAAPNAPATAPMDAAAVPEDPPPAEEPASPGEPVAAVPAGAEVAPSPGPSFLSRGKLRRRLRYLRRVRELGFRDLGGLVFDLDRFGRERPDLVTLKLAGLKSIDAELRALEVALDDIRDTEELLEPGISACARCGALHGSEAGFCPSCGTAVSRPVPAEAAELPAAAPESVPAGSGPDPEQPPA